MSAIGETSTTRRRRLDRNHVLYLIRNLLTQDTYVGLTVCRGQAKVKSARDRWVQHTYNAFVRKLNGPLYENIRQHGEDAFKVEVLDVVRGKAVAHVRETELVQMHQPTLNTLKVMRG